MIRAWLRCSLLVVFSTMAFGAGPERVLKVDPVELAGGKEVPGQDSLFSDHAGYRYLFSSDTNKARFLKEPAKFEIQLGGACARMGPLSGEGSTDLFAVHDGRIYLFASEACRKTFLSGPEKFLETPDEVPTGDPAAVQRGKELIELAVKGLGGAAKFDALKSMQAEVISKPVHDKKTYTHREAWTIRYPADFRKDDDWDDSKWAAVATKGDAFQASKEVRTLHAQQRAALERDFYHLPWVLLRQRNAPGFVAVASGKGSAGDAPVEYVTIAHAGTTVRLGIDSNSGRVLTSAYRGRGPTMVLGTVEVAYSDFTSMNGVDIPWSVAVSFDGKPVADSAKKLTSLVVDGNVAESLFKRPNP